jgi:hypothetical protein
MSDSDTAPIEPVTPSAAADYIRAAIVREIEGDHGGDKIILALAAALTAVQAGVPRDPPVGLMSGAAIAECGAPIPSPLAAMDIALIWQARAEKLAAIVGSVNIATMTESRDCAVEAQCALHEARVFVQSWRAAP